VRSPDELLSATGRPVAAAVSTATKAALVLLTFAGTLLRVFHLGNKSLWMDEAASVALARMPWHQFAWVWWLEEGNMTAYYLLLRPWLHIGNAEGWIRLLSVLFGIAAIPAIFFLARQLMRTNVAIIAAAFLAVNPAHVYYSQEARSYSMLVFFAIMSCFYFVRAMETHRSPDWLLWVLFSVIAVYTHYFAALVLVTQAVSVFLLRSEKVQWTRLVGWSLVIIVLTLPGISFVLFRGNTIPLPWIPRPSAKEVVHLFMFLGGSGPKFAVYALLWTAGLLSIVRTWRKNGRSEESWRTGLLVIWVVLPIVIAALASLHHSVFAQKYLLICLPPIIVLGALGADTIRPKVLGIVMVVALCAFSVGTDIRNSIKPREDWRGAVNSILTLAEPGDAIVFYPFYSRVAYDYYQHRFGPGAPPLRVFAPPFYGAGEDQTTLQKILASETPNFRHVWVVIRGGKENLQEQSPAFAAALESRFGSPQLRQFQDIVVLEFGS